MKRKAVLENLARNVYRQYRGKKGKNVLRRYPYESYKLSGVLEVLGATESDEIVIFKLQFEDMKREMFSGLEVSEYDQEVLYKAVRQEYLEGPIWCRGRNTGDYLVEYMMIKEGASGNYVQVEIRNFHLGVYKK